MKKSFDFSNKFVSIDPGFINCGVCVFIDGKLIEYHNINLLEEFGIPLRKTMTIKNMKNSEISKMISLMCRKGYPGIFKDVEAIFIENQMKAKFRRFEATIFGKYEEFCEIVTVSANSRYKYLNFPSNWSYKKKKKQTREKMLEVWNSSEYLKEKFPDLINEPKLDDIGDAYFQFQYVKERNKNRKRKKK